MVSNFTIVHITAGNIWIFHPAFSTPSSYIYISCSSFHAYSETNLYCNYISVIGILYYIIYIICLLYIVCYMWSVIYYVLCWMYLDHAGWPLTCLNLGWNLLVLIGFRKRIPSARPVILSIFPCISHRMPIWMELPLWRIKKWMNGFLIPVRNTGRV